MIGVCLLIFAGLILLCGSPNPEAESLYYEQDFEALYAKDSDEAVNDPVKQSTSGDAPGEKVQQESGRTDEVDAASLAASIYESSEM